MKKLVAQFSVAAIFVAPSVGHSQPSDRVAPSVRAFGAVMDTECNELEETSNEAASLLVPVLTKLAVNTVVGFASTLLDKATTEDKEVYVGFAPGHLFFAKSDKWYPNPLCLKFWYADRGNLVLPKERFRDYGTPPIGQEPAWKVMNERWANLGFTTQPYLYGEVRMSFNGFDNTVTLHPVALFARSMPGTKGIFRRTKRMLVGIDLKPLQDDKTFLSLALEVPSVEEGAVFIQGENAITGYQSAWGSMPPPRETPPALGEKTSTPFTSVVTFTSTTDGTLFGKAFTESFKGQKDNLVTALLPKSSDEKAQSSDKAIEAVFNALALVLEAEKTLAMAAEADKPKRALELRKAQWEADNKLKAARLQPRFNVTGP